MRSSEAGLSSSSGGTVSSVPSSAEDSVLSSGTASAVVGTAISSADAYGTRPTHNVNTMTIANILRKYFTITYVLSLECVYERREVKGAYS